MTDSTVNTFIIQLPATIAALAAAFIALATLFKSREGVEVSKDNGHKADIITDKTTEIHSLTNSRLTEVTSALAIATSKIEGLQKTIADMQAAKGVADRLADKATTLPEPAKVEVVNQPSSPIPTKPIK